MSYTHLSARERLGLFYMHQYGYSLREIARRLGRSHSTLSRELKRNARPIAHHGYCDRYAHTQAVKRQQIPRSQARYQCKALRDYVFRQLAIGWSPQIIAQRIQKAYPRQHHMRISHETIYQWLYRDALTGGSQYLWLVRAHKKRRKQRPNRLRTLIPNRIDIRQRPAAIDNRHRYGHWEGDTMIGKQHQGRLVTHVERKSRYLLASVIRDGKAEQFNAASIRCYENIPSAYRRTLTLDNGSENTQHEALSKALGMQIYFATPYASWERGTNENTNGLLRRYFPKQTNFLEITQKQLDKVVHLLNHRPRKCLNYQTPFEVFNKVTGGALGS